MRHGGIEKSAVVLAAVLIIGGATFAVWPVDMTYFPASNYRVPLNVRSQAVQLSKGDCRVYGWIGVALGVGLGYAAVYVRRR